MLISQLYIWFFFEYHEIYCCGKRSYKTFFKLVLEVVLRTLNICSTEYDSKNQSYESFGVRSPLNTIWSILQKVVEEILRL